MSTSYQGIERRRHRVYVTRNTEYHVRDGVCVAVRDRSAGRFRDGHIALKLRLEGGVKKGPGGWPIHSLSEPEIGDAIYFVLPSDDDEERQITTSRVERIERPAKTIVASYRL